MRAELRNDRGSTIVEVVLASALFLAVLMPALTLVASSSRVERGQQERKEALEELRGAMTQLTKDLRQALVIEGTPASHHRRLDMTTLVGGAERSVAYEMVGTALSRSLDGGPPHVLAENLDGAAYPTFCYSYDSAARSCVDSGGPSPPVTVVRISLALDPDGVPGSPISLATDVQLRNEL